MGIVAEVLSADGVDIKSDRGSRDNVTAQHFTAAGVDSRPIATDYVALSEAAGSGRQTAVGYLDKNNAPKAKPGEFRTYARDESGSIVSEVWQKSDGSVEISNKSGGSIKMLADGSIDLNGFTISKTGQATDSNGISLHGHKHPQQPDSAGNTEKDTGVAKK